MVLLYQHTFITSIYGYAHTFGRGMVNGALIQQVPPRPALPFLW